MGTFNDRITPVQCNNAVFIAPNNTQKPAQPDSRLAAMRPEGICSRLEAVGTGAIVVGGASFLAGTALDGTFVGAVVGVPLQTFGGIGVAVGSITAGTGVIGKDLGLCQ